MTKLNIKMPKLLKGKASLDARKARAGYVFALPFLIGVVLIYLPILIDSIWFTFTKEVTIELAPGVYEDVIDYVWLEYYDFAFFKSPNFVSNLLSGIQQLIFEVPAIIIFSLFIAVVLNQKMLGRAAFRAIFFVPVIIATGLMETINAQDVMSSEMQGGIDSGAGDATGSQIISTLDVEQLFRTMKVGGELVTYVVNLVNDIYNIINYSGVQMLIFLAGLQSISPSIYEACEIEGATAWETFWKVTFPMISPMILVNAVYTIIDALTRNSNTAMKFISEAMDSNRGQGSAMAWIFFFVVILIIAAVAGIVSSFIFYQRRD